MMNHKIVCVGEILWDSLPAGLFLGGAPFNVAHGLHELGNDVHVISRVGRDFLGEEVIRRLSINNIPTDMIQVDAALPTGFVEVSVDGGGNPRYRICEPVAWDFIETNKAVIEAVKSAEAMVFGTLACRSKTSRDTIYALAGSAAFNVLDVNLRGEAVSKEVVAALLETADVVKMNSGELATLSKWFSIVGDEREAAERLADRFQNSIISVSDGANGGSIWHNDRWVHHPGFDVEGRDIVGAGDAFLAGLLTSYLQGKSDEEMIATANLYGAYVVTKDGATPRFDFSEIEAVKTRAKK